MTITENRSALSEFRILLVEDDDGDAGLIQWALKRQRDFAYSLDRARTLEDCLGICADREFDIILLDLNLPGSSHLSTLIAVIEQVPDPAVIVVSGLNDQETALQAVAAGAQDYLVKHDLSSHDICRAIWYGAERKRSRNALVQMREDFITSVSHELRTPLTASAAAVELIQAGIDDLGPDDLRQVLEIAANNLLLLRGLVNNLIDSGLVESAAIGLRPGQVSPHELADSAVRALRATAQTARVGLTVPDDPGGTVYADPDRTVQVLINLILNAIAATPTGGEVTVSVRPDPDGGTVFAVADTGHGIDPDRLAVVLDRRRSDPQDISAASGARLGLGLYVSRAIIEAHGGSLTARSTMGRGSVFEVLLPGRDPR